MHVMNVIVLGATCFGNYPGDCYLKINNNEIEHLRCSGQIDRY